MGWNYVATFSPTAKWKIANLPAGSVDESGTLWVMWEDPSDQQLACFSQSIPQAGRSFDVDITPLHQGTGASPCLMNVDGQLVALWRGSGSDLSLHWGVLDPKKPPSLSPQGTIPGSNAADGPLAAFVPATDSLFVAWKGLDGNALNTNFYYSNVTGLGKPEPHAAAAQWFVTSDRYPAPFDPYSSYHSPAVAAMREEGIAVVWTNSGNSHLVMASAPNPSKPVLSTGIYVSFPGGVVVTDIRPSLAVHGTGPEAPLVVVYVHNNKLYYLVHLHGAVQWSRSRNGTVPLVDLLAHAGPNEGAVTLTNPVAVWVTAPRSNDTLYLLVGDRGGGWDIEGPLYLVRYTGDDT